MNVISCKGREHKMQKLLLLLDSKLTIVEWSGLRLMDWQKISKLWWSHEFVKTFLVDAESMKTKVSKVGVRAIPVMITKKNRSKTYRVDEGTGLLESFWNFANPEESEIFSELVRPNLHLLNARNGLWKMFFNVTLKTTDTSNFFNCLTSS